MTVPDVLRRVLMRRDQLSHSSFRIRSAAAHLSTSSQACAHFSAPTTPHHSSASSRSLSPLVHPGPLRVYQPLQLVPRISKASREKGQMSITSFLAKPKTSSESNMAEGDKPNDPRPSDDKPEDDAEDSSSSRGVVHGDGTGEIAKGGVIENSDLPPIHDIPSIFSDLVSRIPQIMDVVDHLEGRKLRVATMCSGTESPLLALNLIRRYILDHFGVTLDYEHVFSCEIEPFKQAYIERNFQPPILFRDVCELHQDEAQASVSSY